TPPPGPTTNGKGSLVGPGDRLSVIGGRVAVTERCQSSVLCRGRFSLTTTVRVRKHKKLATVRCALASFRVRAHHSATIRARVTGRCLRLLRARRNHWLSVLYTSGAKTGQAGQRKRITLVLEQPRREKRRRPR